MWCIRHSLDNGFALLDRRDARCSVAESKFVRDALGLLDVKYAVISEQNRLRLAFFALGIADNLLLADVPERDDGRLFAFPNVST